MQQIIYSEADKEFIHKNESENIQKLALSLNKKYENKSNIDFILNQVYGRQISKRKIRHWYKNDDIVYPSHLSMEQSSSDITAIYKASLIDHGSTLIDLTGGLGVDFYFLSSKYSKSVYVEQNQMLCNIADHNFKALGLSNYDILNKSGEEYLNTLNYKADTIYIDPSRRDELGNKVFKIEDCSPNIIDIQDDLLKKSSNIMLKFSPMLDISLAQAEIKGINEIHIISVDNECKELVFILSKGTFENTFHTINLKKDGTKESFIFKKHEEENAQIQYSDIVNKYLYEPNSSILKAGSFKYIAKRFNLLKLHPNSHLYTSNELTEDFPGRIFEVKDYFSPNKKNIKKFVMNNKKANITARNYPHTVTEIRNKTNIKDGGDVYLFVSTLASGLKTWINCIKI